MSSLLNHVASSVGANGTAYFDTCACGGTLCIGTDGNGRAIEVCDRGCPTRIVPRVSGLELAVAVYNDPVIQQLRADAERRREKHPLCAKRLRCSGLTSAGSRLLELWNGATGGR